MIIGSKILHKNKIYNSLDWAKENIKNAPDGSVFIADEHEFTRGRQNRSWIFDKDQLVVTLLLKPKNLNNILPKDLDTRLNQLNMAITLGILESLKIYNIGLKWPNDFYYENYKVGGMISQVVWQDNKISGIIFAFAINVNNLIKNKNLEFKACSISEILGHKIDKQDLFQKSLISINSFYESWLNFEFDNIFKRWKSEQVYLGKNIKIHKINGEIVTGKFKDLLDNGDIILEIQNNICEQIAFNIVENIIII